MEFGATELYLATLGVNLPADLHHSDPLFYLHAAAHWASAYIHDQDAVADTLNLGDISGLAHFELHRALSFVKSSNGFAVSQADLLSDLRRKLDSAIEQAGKDPFGFGISWGHGETPSYGAGLSVMASEYDYLTHSDTYSTYSRAWLANILGANAWGSSFIVGDGSVFPHCMHHQIANLTGSKNGEAPILAGAVVGGPNRNADSGAPRDIAACPVDGNDPFGRFNGNGAAYKDNSRYYSTVEPAIDFTSSSFLMFAWQIAGAPSGTL
jgi:endoglucanase